MKKTLCIIILVPLLVLIAATTGMVKSDEPVAYFGKTPVYAEEVDFHLRDQLALVAVYFKHTHQVDLSGDIWLKSHNGEVPADVLKTRALEACLTAKIIQRMAMEHHVGTELPFPGFTEACNQMNQSRLNDQKQGRILHGLIEYSPRQLYKYQMGNLRNQLLEVYSDGDYEQAEIELSKAIRKHRETETLKVDQKKMTRITVGLIQK